MLSHIFLYRKYPQHCWIDSDFLDKDWYFKKSTGSLLIFAKNFPWLLGSCFMVQKVTVTVSAHMHLGMEEDPKMFGGFGVISLFACVLKLTA